MGSGDGHTCSLSRTWVSVGNFSPMCLTCVSLPAAPNADPERDLICWWADLRVWSLCNLVTSAISFLWSPVSSLELLCQLCREKGKEECSVTAKGKLFPFIFLGLEVACSTSEERCESRFSSVRNLALSGVGCYCSSCSFGSWMPVQLVWHLLLQS